MASAATLIAVLACRASATDVDFRPTASVSSGTILLKDVADVTGTDPAIVQQLQNVKLAPAPAPEPEPDPTSGGAEVVRLDRFRKK